MYNKNSGEINVKFYVLLGSITTIIFILILMFGLPVYNVWNQGQRGKANLRKAEQEKQILIEQARAEVDAAELRAEAIQLVGEAAQKYPEYRLQEFIGAFAESMASDKIEQIIYVPTEANIPIVEAGRTVIQAN